MAKRDSERNRGGGRGDGKVAAAERVVMAAETLVASQISAAATTISSCLEHTSLLAVGWKVYFRLILFNIMLNLVNVICLSVYFLRIDNEKSHLWVVHETKDTIRKILFMRVLPYLYRLSVERIVVSK
jgi:hypothetical protein